MGRKPNQKLGATEFPVVPFGVDPSNDISPINVDENGNVQVSLSDGGQNDDGEMVIAGYDDISDVVKTRDSAPEYDHYQGETLADITNGADGSYYYYVDMASYKHLAAQFVLNGGSGTVTVTVEATLQDDGTDPASCAYEDVTNDLFGVASFTSSDMAIVSTPVPFKYIRFKVVASTGGANDASWTIYSRRAA